MESIKIKNAIEKILNLSSFDFFLDFNYDEIFNDIEEFRSQNLDFEKFTQRIFEKFYDYNAAFMYTPQKLKFILAKIPANENQENVNNTKETQDYTSQRIQIKKLLRDFIESESFLKIFDNEDNRKRLENIYNNYESFELANDEFLVYLFKKLPNLMDFPDNVFKISVLGLDNSGKTILCKFQMGIENPVLNPIGTKPTTNFNNLEWKIGKLEIHFIDTGGATRYRIRYTKSVHQVLFDDSEILFFVLDFMDSERYDEVFKYFEEILDIALKIKPDPLIYLLLHKFEVTRIPKNEIKRNLKRIYKILNNMELKIDFKLMMSSLNPNENLFSRNKFKRIIEEYYNLNPDKCFDRENIFQ